MAAPGGVRMSGWQPLPEGVDPYLVYAAERKGFCLAEEPRGFCLRDENPGAVGPGARMQSERVGYASSASVALRKL
jgi:hypothetical protein